jgi:cytochrome P450
MNFFGNMVLYPEVQRKVHEELDEIIGRGRIPTMSDVSAGNLVYLRATWNESLRNTPTVPVGAYHNTCLLGH